MITQDEVKSAVNTVRIIADTIREVKNIPAGELYSLVMGHMSLQGFNSIINILKRAGLVQEVNFMLTWIGPDNERGMKT